MSRLLAALVLAALCAGCRGFAPSTAADSQRSAPAAIPNTDTERVVYSFHQLPGGEIPEAALIVDPAGGFYGTTTRGGTSLGCGSASGCGTIFRLALQNGKYVETTLHSFDPANGLYPGYPLTRDSSGDLFSTTQVANPLGNAYGLFRQHGAWRFRILHSFQGGYDGAQPRSDLVIDKHGNLFGTTVAGGTGGSGGNGMVYELTPTAHGAWKETVVHRFTQASNGTNPQAGVVFASGGDLYGTASYGGNTACAAGCGTVFKLKSSNGSWSATLLHAFDGVDGALPLADLVADRAGNLYGSAEQGAHSGCFGGCGTLFELHRLPAGRWKFAVIHVFDATNGGSPSGNMVFDSAGNLYGATVGGGNAGACPQTLGCGVVFKLAPGARGAWLYTVLHKFNNSPDGALPNDGLGWGADGKLYGTTIGGGALSLGSVFQVSP